MKNKKKWFLLIISIIIIFIVVSSLYLFKKNTTSKNIPIINSKEINDDSIKGKVSAKIVGNLAAKERLIATINRKNILVYQSNGEQLDYITHLKFIDIDHDGEQELFISVDTIRNEYPRELFFILKKEHRKYQVLNLKYPKGASKEGFEITPIMNGDMTSILIQNNIKKIIFAIPIEQHYRKDQMITDTKSVYEAFTEMNPKANAAIGSQTYMFHFEFKKKHDTDYVCASQYVTGILGPTDILGEIYTTFHIRKDKIVVNKIDFKSINEFTN